MESLHNAPFTATDSIARRRFTESEAQAEYVFCMQEGIQFAASGPNGEWLYRNGNTIMALRWDHEKAFDTFKSLEWIPAAQAMASQELVR